MSVLETTTHARAGARSPGLRGILFVCGIAGVLCTPDPGWAHDDAAPRGRVLFESTFSESEQPGMTFDREGVWSIRDGVLHGVLPDEKQKRSFAYIGEETWTDYSVDVDVSGIRGVDKGLAVRMEGSKAVVVDLRGGNYADLLVYRGYSRLGREPLPNHNGEWNHLRVEVEGARYRVLVDGKLVIDRLEYHDKRPRGRIALVAYTGGVGECELVFDNVVVRDLR